MALITGKDCGNEVSDSAESCPKCGAPVPKTVGFGIVLPAILALFAFLMHAGFGTFVLLIMLIPIIGSARRLMTGEIWWRSTNVHTG